MQNIFHSTVRQSIFRSIIYFLNFDLIPVCPLLKGEETGCDFPLDE